MAPSVHDVVLNNLAAAAGDAYELRLISRVNSPKLEDVAPGKCHLFVPDLHLLTAAREAAYPGYGFNFAADQLLGRVLKQMGPVRQALRSPTFATELVTIQLGDFFDLWREFPRAADLSKVAHGDHALVRDALYRDADPNVRCLDATILLGNHDTKGGVPLPDIPFSLRYFDDPDAPTMFATHGDAYDVIENALPDSLQEWFVQILGPLTPTNAYTLENWPKHVEATNKRMSQMRTSIQGARHALAGAGAVRVPTDQPLPDIVAETPASTADEHDTAKTFADAMESAAARWPSIGGVRLVVTGHSHHPRLVWMEHRDPPILFMDCGAWIEKVSYPLAEGGTSGREPSAQLGVFHDGDARIYQFRRP